MAVCRCCLPPTGWPVPPYSMLRLHSVGILFNVALSCLAVLHCAALPWVGLVCNSCLCLDQLCWARTPKPILDIFTMSSSKFNVCLFVCVWVSSCNCTGRLRLQKGRFCLPAGTSHLPYLHWPLLIWTGTCTWTGPSWSEWSYCQQSEQGHSNRTWDWEGANVERSRWTIWHFAQRPKGPLGRSKRHLDISCRPFFILTPMFPVKKLQESNKNHWSPKYSDAPDMQHHIDAREGNNARFHRCLLWVP